MSEVSVKSEYGLERVVLSERAIDSESERELKGNNIVLCALLELLQDAGFSHYFSYLQ